MFLSPGVRAKSRQFTPGSLYCRGAASECQGSVHMQQDSQWNIRIHQTAYGNVACFAHVFLCFRCERITIIFKVKWCLELKVRTMKLLNIFELFWMSSIPHMRRWVDNIRMDLQEVESGHMDWIGLAQDRDSWRKLVSAVMNIRIPWNAGNFLTSCKPVSFSRMTLHHGVSK
jgi:hypothetical protein